MPADPLAGRLAESMRKPMNQRLLRGTLRGIAIAIAVAALVDPVLTIERAPATADVDQDDRIGRGADRTRAAPRQSCTEVRVREAVHHRLPCGPGERCVVMADGSVDAELPSTWIEPLSLIAG